MPVSDDVELELIATRTEGFSGADLHILCREASMMPVRKLIEGKNPAEIQEMRQFGLLEAPLITQEVPIIPL